MSDLAGLRVKGSCSPPCLERFMAICNDEFGPAKSLGGWIFRAGPYRELGDLVRWRAVYYGHDQPDHTGEPYVWVVCPFCGGSLSEPPDDEGLEDKQADGC